MFENRTTDELARIARAGGGFKLSAGPRATDDLARIARAASTSNARLYLTGLASRTTEEIARIGRAGGGAVVFWDD